MLKGCAIGQNQGRDKYGKEGRHSTIGIKQSAMGTFEHLFMFSSVLSTLTDSELGDQILACYQGAYGSKRK